MNSRTLFWAYATSFGAAWGLLEFGIGSFLHNLRLPMGGQIMAMLGLVVLLAQRQLLPRRGLSLATGFIAAACKVLSPGGIILGPMIGIPAEALLVELALLLAPRAWLSAVLAGSLAALWPLSQKILTQFIYFGGDLVGLLQALLLRSQRVLKISDEHLNALGLLSLFTLMALGSLSALIGRRIGQKLDHFEPLVVPNGDDNSDNNTDNSIRLAEQTAIQKTANSAPALWQKFVPDALIAQSNVILAGLLAMSLVAWVWWNSLVFACFVGLFVISLALLQSNKARRLWMPRFWLWSLVLAGLSGLMLGTADLKIPGFDQVLLSSTGLLAGLAMLSRALFIFSASVWISGNIDQQKLIQRLQHFSLQHDRLTTFFPHELGAAILSAPALMRELALLLEEIKNQHVQRHLVDRLRWPYQVLFELLHRAKKAAEQTLLEQFKNTVATNMREDEFMSTRPYFAAIIGDRAQGKTRTIFQIHQLLQEAKIPGTGLCQPAHPGRLAYDLVDLASQETRLFARRRQSQEIQRDKKDIQRRRLGYLFDAEAWAWAEERLRQAWTHEINPSVPHVLFLDELGRLEARGQGHMRVVHDLLKQHTENAPALIFVAVQKAVADEVKAQLGGFDSQIDLSTEPEALLNFTINALRQAALPFQETQLADLAKQIFAQRHNSARKEAP